MSPSARTLSWVLAGALGAAACTTDVSSPTSFGTQGNVVTGLSGPSSADSESMPPNCMAAGPDGVYWATSNVIYYAPKSGDPPGAYPRATSTVDPVARIAVDDESLYWTEIIGGDNPGGRVMKVSPPLTGDAVYQTLYAEAGGILGNDETIPFDLGFLAVDQGTVRIAFHRPEVRNAISTQVGHDMLDVFTRLIADPQDYRCVILTATGDKAFCAGADLKERNGMTNEEGAMQAATDALADGAVAADEIVR